MSAPIQFTNVTAVAKANLYFDGKTATTPYDAGQYFDVPMKSGFTVTVAGGICEYICSFVG